MGKNKKFEDQEMEEIQVADEPQEMTLEEARAFRLSLAKAKKQELPEEQKREEFRKYWAQHKASFGQGKEYEPIIWAHLKAIGLDHPSQFDQGIKHFGLQKVK
jgi:hypothetical protein